MTKKFENPASTVDLIVEMENGIVLVKRKHDPFSGQWALPGGYLNCGEETLEMAASRELKEETSLTVNSEDLDLVGVYSDPKRDPRGHVIAHVYRVAKCVGELIAADDAEEVKTFREIPENLAFDHNKILDDYFRRYK